MRTLWIAGMMALQVLLLVSVSATPAEAGMNGRQFNVPREIKQQRKDYRWCQSGLDHPRCRKMTRKAAGR